MDAAATAAIVPLSGDGIGHDILVGASGDAPDDVPVAAFNYVSPGYFETLQTPFLVGHDFDEHDRLGSPNVAIVNQAFVDKFAQGKNPLDSSSGAAIDEDVRAVSNYRGGQRHEVHRSAGEPRGYRVFATSAE